MFLGYFICGPPVVELWPACGCGTTGFYDASVPIRPHLAEYPLPGRRLDLINESAPVEFRGSGIDAEQVPAVDLVGHVSQLLGHAVGDDHVGFGLEGGKVAHDA